MPGLELLKTIQIVGSGVRIPWALKMLMHFSVNCSCECSSITQTNCH